MCPFIIFSRVNHQNQIVTFATNVVSNEIEDTYVWLFEQLMKVMKDKVPMSVITYDDLTMKNAIKSLS